MSLQVLRARLALQLELRTLTHLPVYPRHSMLTIANSVLTIETNTYLTSSVSHTSLKLIEAANKMTSQSVYPHIAKGQEQPAHLQRLPRIRVAQIVMDYLAYGWSVEEMCRQHPYLRPAEAYAAMGYYFDNQDEIDDEIRSEWQQAQASKHQAPLSPFGLRIQARGLF